MPKVHAGQLITRDSLTAREWNAMQEAAAWSSQRQINAGIRQSKPSMPPGGVILKNSSGSDLSRFYAAGLSTIGITEATNADGFLREPYFVGAAVTRDYYGRFAILQEQIRSTNLGIAIVSGVTYAYVNVQHADHDRADINNSSHNYLYSNFYGAAEILYKPSGTGLKLCLVRIGSFVAPVRRAVAAGNISAGGSGTVTIKKGSTDSEQVAAHLDWMEGSMGVSTDDELLIQFFPYPDVDKWVIVGAEC